MIKRMAVLALVLCITVSGFAQKAKKAATPTGVVDKAYLQKIWDGWCSLDVAGQKQYYAQGPHVFFDTAKIRQLGRISSGLDQLARRLQSGTLHGQRRRTDSQERRWILDQFHGSLRFDAQVG
jgi:hypothetical protein